MSVAEQSPPPLVPIVPEKATPTLISRMWSSALFVGLLGLGVGVVEGMLVGMVLSGQGGGDALMPVKFALDRGLVFAIAGASMGALAGVVRWAFTSPNRSRS